MRHRPPVRDKQFLHFFIGLHGPALLMDRRKHGTMNFLQSIECNGGVEGLRCGSPTLGQDGGHTDEVHVVWLRLLVLNHRGLQPITVRTPIPEHFNHFDLVF